jgi:hypothetical protein
MTLGVTRTIYRQMVVRLDVDEKSPASAVFLISLQLNLEDTVDIILRNGLLFRNSTW